MPNSSYQYFPSQAEAPLGVCGLIHGLNQPSRVLRHFIEVLNYSGYHCHILTLSGHKGEDWDILSQVEAKAWLEETREFLEHLADDAAKNDLPIYTMAYSLGALVSFSAFIKYPHLRLPERFVLLAPALAIHKRSYLLKLILPMITRVPSLAPPEMQVHQRGLPPAAYKALFDLLEIVKEPWPERILNVPALLLVDPQDELVSNQGYFSLVEKNSWHALNLAWVSTNERQRWNYHHLIASQAHVTQGQKNEMYQLITGFLGGELSFDLADNFPSWLKQQFQWNWNRCLKADRYRSSHKNLDRMIQSRGWCKPLL